MPSTQPLPATTQLRAAASSALAGVDLYADRRDGSLYDHMAGPSAVLFAREAANDRDLFRAIYVDDADGKALTRIISRRWAIPRILDTRGEGVCSLVRPAAVGGAGTLLTGTRIQVSGASPRTYAIAEDTLVGAADLRASVPIVASATGSGVACNVSSGLVLLDPVYDAGWKPATLVCADGTDFEDAATYRARARQLRLAARNGYVDRITAACQAAGASYVLAFPSQYGLAADDFDDDCGLNAVYVGDKNFASTHALVLACTLALESARVLGADLYVGGIAQQPLLVDATVALVDDPGKLPLVTLGRVIVQALLAYFAPTAVGFTYSVNAMAAAIGAAEPLVQGVTFRSPAAVPPFPNRTGGVVQGWPDTLTRYTLAARNIRLTFTGPG